MLYFFNTLFGLDQDSSLKPDKLRFPFILTGSAISVNTGISFSFFFDLPEKKNVLRQSVENKLAMNKAAGNLNHS